MMISSRRMGFILLLSLQLALATATGSLLRSGITSTRLRSRLAFFPRGGTSASVGGSTSSAGASSTKLLSRSKIVRQKQRPLTTKNAASRRKTTPTKSQRQATGFDYSPQQYQQQEPSVEDLRAQLGPLGLFVANSVELTISTVGSYISGAFLGYALGGAMKVPSTLFGKEFVGLSQRFSALHSKAWASGKSWAQLSAAFQGCHKFVELSRGPSNDNWNSIIGSGLAGAFLSRAGGPQAMIQGGATYAGFSYVVDKMMAPQSSGRQGQQSSELLYTDIDCD